MTDKPDFKTALASVKAAHSITDYMIGAGVQLKSAGGGKWKANCPFHRDKTPSFSVNEQFQNYKCWGCGKHGDIISFVVEYENLTFYEALTKLAEQKNISLTLNSGEQTVDFKSLQKILKLSANFYCKHFDSLAESHPAKKEILDRGLTFDNLDPEGLKYGYSPAGSSLYKYLSKQGFSDELLVESGVCRKSEKGEMYDFFRSRLMFVFTDRYGKPIGFSSRKLYDDDTRGKYVNSTESPLFHKSNVLYNHSIARKAAGDAGCVYIVEGQFDVAAFVKSSMANVVASSGTALTHNHLQECMKMIGGKGKLVFCFDGDEAGFKTVGKIFTNFPFVHDRAFVVQFPEGKDPCDYRLEHGSSGLQKFVENPVTLVEFMIRRAKLNHDITSVVGQANYVSEAASIIKSVTNLTLRESCIRLLSLESLTPVSVVRQAVDDAKPLVVNDEVEVITDEPISEPLLEKDEEKPELKVDLRALMNEDADVLLAARFINLGLTYKPWREALVRNRNLLPKVFDNFLDELDKHSDSTRVFPEMFVESEFADVLINGEFSPLYRFMDVNEMKHQFLYLHKLMKEREERKLKERIQAKIVSLLTTEDSNNLDYFRELILKESDLLASAANKV
jgi:DNA primase catalytic core